MELSLCPICNLTGELIGFSKRAEVYQCGSCFLCYLSSHLRNNAVLDNSWYEHFDKNPEWGEKFVENMEVAYSRQLETLAQLTPGRLIADVGGGPGVFLAVAKKKGWEVIGVEESPHASGFAKKAFSIDFVGKLADVPDGSVDVVRIAHVLEHVPEPKKFLDDLRRIIKPSGILLIIVPNREPLLSKLVNTYRKLKNKRPNLAGAIYPDMHVLGLSTRSLNYMLSKCGFQTEKLFTVSMGNKDYFPLFYDGLLNIKPIQSIRIKEMLKYWLPMWVNNLGNAIHRGEWVVGYFRKID